jgi:hypothetical protein
MSNDNSREPSPVPSNDASSVTAASVSSDGAPMDTDGEFKSLMEGIEDDQEIPLTASIELEIQRTISERRIVNHGELKDASTDLCGEQKSPNDAESLVPPGDGGLIWYATIIPNEFFQNGKLRKGLNRRDFDTEHQKLKLRRPSLPVTWDDFQASLTTVSGPKGERFIFSGVLNGWPALRCFELMAIEERRSGSTLIPSTVELMSDHIQSMLWKRVWDVRDATGPPCTPKSHVVYRAKLRGAPWTGQGWSKDSPGFAFWYETYPKQRLTFGTDMVKVLGEEQCTRVHMVSHRYAVQRESPRDRLTYHSICFLEWDHGLYGTVVETAFLNGLGGYKGLCNWYDDKDDKGATGIYKAMPIEMIQPWLTSRSEVRVLDVKARNLSEFQAYIEKYTGGTKRFVDPHYTFSHDVRLTFRSKRQLAQYFINYISRDSTYGELKRNCQTFSADLCAFLAGKRNISPFHPVNRIEYQPKIHYFLYEVSLLRAEHAYSESDNDSLLNIAFFSIPCIYRNKRRRSDSRKRSSNSRTIDAFVATGIILLICRTE